MAGQDVDRVSPVTPRLQAIASFGDVVKVKAAIMHEYGFEPTEEYCRDLIDFVTTLVLQPDQVAR